MKIFTILLLTVSFFSVGCSHYGKRHKKDWHAKSFKMMDKDGDGSVTKKEFDGRHQEMWTGMDANKDGKVTEEEIKAHHKSMKAKHKGECKSHGKDCTSC